jgi:hypothetical protein
MSNNFNHWEHKKLKKRLKKLRKAGRKLVEYWIQKDLIKLPRWDEFLKK